MPEQFKPRINSYWLLGFVEGEGSFLIRKEQFKLIFTLTQSIKDLVLMQAIKEFLYDLPFVDQNNMSKTSLRLTRLKGKNSNIHLTISQTDWIKFVIIPFFNSMSWQSKNLLDFQDWKRI